MGIDKNEWGFRVGHLPHGERNKISDVPGVTVGHCTLADGDIQTGVTALLPHPGDVFHDKVLAACHVINGFGKTTGLVQIDELGTLETPILFTNTLSVGTVETALVKYMLERNPDICETTGSVNPVVCECNDCGLNDIRGLHVTEQHVFAALADCKADFAEGAVGAGRGMRCHGLKGGIGSASRQIEILGRTYTLGVLVQSNHGCLEELTVCNRRLGEEIIAKRNARPAPEPNDRGSIMMVTATDLPVSDRQLRRIIKRCSVGLARCGSYFGHGSGDVMIGFTTANRMPAGGMHRVVTQQVLTEHTLELAFRAIAEATQEAVLNSLCCADAVTAEDGRVFESIATYL
mgnify:CR=1 FL=1